MERETFLHTALLLYLLLGYVAAYYYARRLLERGGPRWMAPPVLRAVFWLFLIFMPLSAISGLYMNRHISILPQFVGVTASVFWFYGGCIGVMSKRCAPSTDGTEKARYSITESLKAQMPGIVIIATACISFTIAMALHLATPQVLAVLFLLAMVIAFILIFRGLGHCRAGVNSKGQSRSDLIPGKRGYRRLADNPVSAVMKSQFFAANWRSTYCRMPPFS